jgi:uncharacterized pyridoxal phosphate-dependent enzyme
MTGTSQPGDIYRSIGVKPVINASGTTTAYGGTKLRPEAMEVMNKAATVMVNIFELNREAGKIIAETIGAEAAFVSSGAAGGLVLQAAACIAGSDPARMAQLPDSTGLKNEIIIQHSHRFPYDQCYRVGGATLVGVGDGRRCQPWQLEAAYTERTAAVAFLASPFVTRKGLTLEQVCESAHARGVPVIVDAASMLPPRANLRKYLAQGADMVIYSGGKGIRGPQGAGILCGRADLIEAAAANASPNQFLGRGMKVAKEEVMGLVTALQVFLSEDEEAETERYRQMSQAVVDALIEIPGIEVTVTQDEYNYLIPMALISFTSAWNGPSRDEINDRMVLGDPPVYLHTLGDPDVLAVDPINLDDRELETVIRRLREELLGQA